MKLPAILNPVLLPILLITIGSCVNSETKKETPDSADSVKIQSDTSHTIPKSAVVDTLSTKVYSNERFRDVRVERTGDHTFLIRGQGQIFEASFSWVVEDGHEELQKGYTMTDAGAPEWGNFKFAIDVAKKRENSTLMLILFESSPKDGSRQYELPVLLY